MTDVDFQLLEVDPRAYMYVRSMAIRNWADALVELLTNADDAFDKRDNILREEGVAEEDLGDRLMHIELVGDAKLLVRDFAIGMLAERMKECLLKVGSYTSEKGMRGYFSRGAKDISAIGNVHFEGFKDGLYAKCTILRDGTGAVETTDVEATDELRAAAGIANGNGLLVTIDIAEEFRPTQLLANPGDVMDRMSRIFSIRDILSNPRNKIFSRFVDPTTGAVVAEAPTVYTYPKATQVLELEFVVPKYPDATARFTLFMADEEIPQPITERNIEFGIIVQSGKTLHDVTTFRPEFRHTVGAPYFYGRLKCDYINDLLYMFDAQGPTEINPFTIVDPARGGGINVDHPFIKELYSIPTARYELALKDFEDSFGRDYVVANDVGDLLEALELFGERLVANPDRNEPMDWREIENGELLRAIDDVRKEYVRFEDDNTMAIRGDDQAGERQSNTIEQVLQRSEGLEGGNIEILGEGNLVGENEGTLPRLRVFANRRRTQFKIEFDDSIAFPTRRYSVTKTTAQIIMRVHLNHAIIRRYLRREGDEIVGLEKPEAVIVVADMISDALSRLLLEGDTQADRDMFKDMDSTRALWSVTSNLDRHNNNIAASVYSTIEQYLNNQS